MKLGNLVSFVSILVVVVGVLFVYLCHGYYEWNTYQYAPNGYHGESFVQTETYTRNEVYIPITNSKDGIKLHSWFFKPVGVEQEKTPIVVVAHGLGSQKDMGLETYATHFVSLGYAALVIDYRYFGGSTQESNFHLRNFINPWYHVEDIKTVVRFVHNNGLNDASIDVNAVALWGSSFAGGHMLKVAADLGPSMIKCVISQVPHLDGRGASKRGIAQRGVVGTLRLVLIALADYITSDLLGMSPMYVKIVGTSKEVSYMILNEDEMLLYYEKHPLQYLGHWRNLAPARTLAVLSLYNPTESVPHIRVPILIVAALNDPLCPISEVRAAYAKAKNARLHEVNTDHFGIYMGKPLQESLGQMGAFLKEHLH